MFEHLQIYAPRERRLVGVADAALRVAGPLVKAGRRPSGPAPGRILLLRLERIGDLLMTLEAIQDVRRAAPHAEVDLAVGSWNTDLASRIPGVDRVETIDAAWLARTGTGVSLPAMLRRARAWAARTYDLAINFEPDIRTNLVLAAVRAARSVGYRSGGGGALLDVALEYAPRLHTAENARRLVSAVLDVPPRTSAARLELSAEERRRARDRVAGLRAPLVGIHASGGRPVKQWPVERFAELGARLAHEHGATILLTGTAADGALVDRVAHAIPPAQVLNLAGAIPLPELAAVLERVDVLVTGDTGPMHLAAAVGTPVVAVFGPSDPARYLPEAPMHRIVRIDLPCSPCNRIRLPPERCSGGTPDCLTGIDVEMVVQAVAGTLQRTGRAVESGAARG